MNGCRHEALTINMAREHAATPRRNTGEKDEREKKARSSTNTRKEQKTGGKSTATALILASDSTPALTHTHTRNRSAVSPQVRRFGPPHNKRTHRQQSPTNGQEETQRHRLQLNHMANGIRPHPCRKHTTHTKRAITQSATRGSGSSSIHDAELQSTRSHGAHCFPNRTHSSSIP
ncbi:exo-alpha-sialidase [Trypanosoma cruzi]|nr:exo-alpha-sialidase [Trypanosoma cruzi]